MKSLSAKLGVILIGLAILGYTEVCRAEGAWVLWAHFFYKSPSWSLISAYPNYEQCQERANWFRELAPGADGYEKIVGNPASPDLIWTDPDGNKYIKVRIEKTEYIVLTSNKAITHTEDGYVVIEWECFPDTIDPRK